MEIKTIKDKRIKCFESMLEFANERAEYDNGFEEDYDGRFDCTVKVFEVNPLLWKDIIVGIGRNIMIGDFEYTQIRRIGKEICFIKTSKFDQKLWGVYVGIPQIFGSIRDFQRFNCGVFLTKEEAEKERDEVEAILDTPEMIEDRDLRLLAIFFRRKISENQELVFNFIDSHESVDVATLREKFGSGTCSVRSFYGKNILIACDLSFELKDALEKLLQRGDIFVFPSYVNNGLRIRGEPNLPIANTNSNFETLPLLPAKYYSYTGMLKILKRVLKDDSIILELSTIIEFFRDTRMHMSMFSPLIFIMLRLKGVEAEFEL